MVICGRWSMSAERRVVDVVPRLMYALYGNGHGPNVRTSARLLVFAPYVSRISTQITILLVGTDRSQVLPLLRPPSFRPNISVQSLDPDLSIPAPIKSYVLA